MTSSAPSPSTPRTSRPLRAVPAADPAVPHAAPRTSATQFSECVRTIVTLARRRGLRPPAFRSPPRIDGVDRSIQRRRNGSVMVAIRRGDRPYAAIQGDVIEGVVAANHLSGEPADRFRRAAWAALEGRGAVASGRVEASSAGPLVAVEDVKDVQSDRPVGRVA
jgi:hypothetical protein